MFRSLLTLSVGLLISLPFISSPLQAQTFRAAKQDLNKLYQSHPTTFYCGCNIKFSGKQMAPDWESCGYLPRKQANRASRI